MMKAILHIGTEKTGTKTLQELLFINKDLLAHYGVATLDSTGYKDDRKLATYCISDDRVDDHVKALNITDLHARSKWKNKFRRELDKNIKSLDGSVHTIIFTSEHFHSRLVAEEEVLTLSNLLKNYFDDFKVIVYLRRQDEVATSLYSTALRVGLFMKNVLPDPESQFSSRY